MGQASTIKDFLVALGFKTDNAGLSQMQGAMKGVELNAKALNAALGALATAAVVAVRQTASELDKLYFSSQRIGASAGNINAFGNAISQMGGSAEGAVNTLETLAEKMRNSPGYEGMLNSLGVGTKDANGNARDRVEIMKDLSGVLSKMPVYQANAYAGSLGIDQNTLLAMRDGKFISNMEKYQKLQKEMGMSDDLTKSGNEFMSEYRDLTMMTKTGLQVIIMQAGKALIPVLRLLNQMLQAGIHAFSQLNPQVKNFLGTGLRLGMFTLVLGGLVKTFGLLFKFMPMLKGFIGLLKLMRLAFLASPIGIILALVAALALLWQDWKTWKEGGNSFFDWGKWTNGFDNIIKKIKDFLSILENVKDKVIQFIHKVVDDPVGAVKDVAQAAKGEVDKLANKAPDSAKKAIQKTQEVVKQSAAVAVGAGRAVVHSVQQLASTAGGGKALNVSERDIIDIMKVASTEVVGSLKGEDFEKQAAGVIDTILNRTASGHYGNSVRDVVNKRWAFSAINAPRKEAFGKVQNVPMSHVSKRMERFVREYIRSRANGKESSVGENLAYANPYYLGEASEGTKAWVREVEKQAKQTGQIFGKGKAIHVHGTPRADQWKKPRKYHVALNGVGKNKSLANFAQHAQTPDPRTYTPPKNPHRSQINSSRSSSSNLTIHQEYNTTMTINGAREPVESANAVKRNQDNAMAIMTRSAQNVMV
ncbi:cell wall hydrolase [Acinetobacter sp. ANC 5502]